MFTVIVTITDDQGAAAEGSFEVTVENVAPEAILGADLTINEGDLLNRAGEINDPGADTWSIAVDWGDGMMAHTRLKSVLKMMISGRAAHRSRSQSKTLRPS
jgi:hypothetical protein